MRGLERRGCAGFTYLTVLFIIAFMGVGLALVSELWHTASLRDKEAELLFVGNQYRLAIQRYTLNGPRLYPRSLEDLLKDPRRPDTVRYLRKLYPDPITGKDWALVKAPDGGIMGVHSLSEAKPVKIAGFRLRDQAFESAEKYSDWKFVYAPVGQVVPQKPSAAAVMPRR